MIASRQPAAWLPKLFFAQDQYTGSCAADERHSMCITLIRVPASARAEEHCYRACYVAGVALVATSRSETRYMLFAFEKTLQRARSETVSNHTIIWL